MSEYSIRNKCWVNTNRDADTFVGIRCENQDISIHFPLGFDISEEDKELRREILLLVNIIALTTAKKDSETKERAREYNETAFPFQAYLAVLYDFFARGYYKEQERIFEVSRRGKIHWNRTIKTQKPYMQDGNAFYLDFVTGKNSINDNELITLIHEYCVYDSFEKIGWIFTDTMPKVPRISYNQKLFRRVLKDKLNSTFQDKNKSLFRNMLAIVDYQGEQDSRTNYRYGTYKFEHVWEAMIDKVYGVENKKEFFPRTYWRLGDELHPNACLEPDSIMIFHGDIYVLDAKYYKYGSEPQPQYLPGSTDINKQITYGEYLANQEKYKKIYGEDCTVYNAFLMPYNARENPWNSDATVLRVGEALGDWKRNDKSYERIQGILVDVKHLMRLSVRQDETEMTKLAETIQQYVDRWEGMLSKA